MFNNAALVALSAIIICSLVGFVLMFQSTGQESKWRALKEAGEQAFAQHNSPQALSKFEDAAKIAKETFGESDKRYIDTNERLLEVKKHSAQKVLEQL